MTLSLLPVGRIWLLIPAPSPPSRRPGARAIRARRVSARLRGLSGCVFSDSSAIRPLHEFLRHWARRSTTRWLDSFPLRERPLNVPLDTSGEAKRYVMWKWALFRAGKVLRDVTPLLLAQKHSKLRANVVSRPGHFLAHENMRQGLFVQISTFEQQRKGGVAEFVRRQMPTNPSTTAAGETSVSSTFGQLCLLRKRPEASKFARAGTRCEWHAIGRVTILPGLSISLRPGSTLSPPGRQRFHIPFLSRIPPDRDSVPPQHNQ